MTPPENVAARLRVLSAEDAPAYLAVRLRALREHPEAFATSYEEERQRPLDQIALRLAHGPERATVGAFVGDTLVGTATVVRSTRSKQRHRAALVAMYVAPEARGSGLGRALLDAVVEIARGLKGVVDLHLAVTVGNVAARGLYLGVGFVPYAVEPRSLRVAGRYHDVEWMVLGLDQSA